MPLKEVKISEAQALLDQGYTRYKKEREVVGAPGSLEEQYHLTPRESKRLFAHKGLKGYRRATLVPETLEIIDDTMEIVDDSTPSEGEAPDPMDTLFS